MHMILTRAQSSFSDVIKTTILLKDMKDFQTVNEIYAQCFKGQKISRGIFHHMDFPKKEINEVLFAKLIQSGTLLGNLNLYD